jgi:hypothetical protein
VVGRRALQQPRALAMPTHRKTLRRRLALRGVGEQLDRERHVTHLLQHVIQCPRVKALGRDRSKHAPRIRQPKWFQRDRRFPAHARREFSSAHRRDERDPVDRRDQAKQLLDRQRVGLPRRLEVVKRQQSGRLTEVREHRRAQIARRCHTEDERSRATRSVALVTDSQRANHRR